MPCHTQNYIIQSYESASFHSMPLSLAVKYILWNVKLVTVVQLLLRKVQLANLVGSFRIVTYSITTLVESLYYFVQLRMLYYNYITAYFFAAYRTLITALLLQVNLYYNLQLCNTNKYIPARTLGNQNIANNN